MSIFDKAKEIKEKLLLDAKKIQAKSKEGMNKLSAKINEISEDVRHSDEIKPKSDVPPESDEIKPNPDVPPEKEDTSKKVKEHALKAKEKLSKWFGKK